MSPRDLFDERARDFVFAEKPVTTPSTEMRKKNKRKGTIDIETRTLGKKFFKHKMSESIQRLPRHGTISKIELAPTALEAGQDVLRCRRAERF